MIKKKINSKKKPVGMVARPTIGLWLKTGLMIDQQTTFSYDLVSSDIINKVCAYYNCSPNLLNKKITKTREKEAVLCRYTCFYLIKLSTKMSLGRIGKMFGGYDHATILHGISAIKSSIETREESYTNLIEILESLRAIPEYKRITILKNINDCYNKNILRLKKR